NHQHFVQLVARHFEAMQPVPNGFHSPRPTIVPRIIMRKRKWLEQVQICVGVPSHPIAHQRRHASYILNTILGGGMSSRLFQKIEAVTAEDVQTLAKEFSHTESIAVTVLGNLNGLKLTRDQLAC